VAPADTATSQKRAITKGGERRGREPREQGFVQLVLTQNNGRKGGLRLATRQVLGTFPQSEDECRDSERTIEEPGPIRGKKKRGYKRSSLFQTEAAMTRCGFYTVGRRKAFRREHAGHTRPCRTRSDYIGQVQTTAKGLNSDHWKSLKRDVHETGLQKSIRHGRHLTNRNSWAKSRVGSQSLSRFSRYTGGEKPKTISWPGRKLPFGQSRSSSIKVRSWR